MGIKALLVISSLLVLLVMVAGCTGNNTTSTTTTKLITKFITTTKTITHTLDVTPGVTTTTPTINDYEQRLMDKLRNVEAARTISDNQSIENEILYVFLGKNVDHGQDYIILRPKLTTTELGNSGWGKKNLTEYFLRNGYDISSLLDKYNTFNYPSNTLALDLTMDNGVFIDYDNSIDDYLQEATDGMCRDGFFGAYFGDFIYPNFQHFAGIHEVSLPAYDPETGYVLLYSSFLLGPVWGEGKLRLFLYDKGELIELLSYQMWVS
jgi:hypothetical protein